MSDTLGFTPTPDLIIVGAGSAGCVLARRLTETTGLKVLLVEAGGEATDPRIADPAAWPMLQKTEVDWDFATVPQPRAGGIAHPWPRGKVIGGSSAIHAMGHMRGHPADYAAWVEQGATGWGWNDLLPFFIRSETSPFAGEPGYGGTGPVTLMQPDPPHPLTEAHRAAGIAVGLTPLRDHNGAGRMDGPTINTLTIRNGRRQSVSDAYLTPEVRARDTLEILTGVMVDRLLFNADASVSGIVVLRDGTPFKIASRAGVVLSAGSIGSPVILMRSGLGPAEELKDAGVTVQRDVPGVGANLSDHLLAAGVIYEARRPVPPTDTQHSESLTYIHAKGQTPEEAPELVVGCVTAPIVSDALAGSDKIPPPGTGYSLLFGITHPRSRGKLTITTPDPFSHPKIDPCYLSSPEDMDHFVEALDWARMIGGASPYDAWRKSDVLPNSADLESGDAKRRFIGKAAWSHHHPVGTCRMGQDEAAVVSPELKVPWIENLFVCDSSIFPSLTTGPVNGPVVAVAERGAEIIAAHFIGRVD